MIHAISLAWIEHELSCAHDRSSIREREKQALAAYEGGDALYDYVFPLSSAEQRMDLRQRRLQTLNHYQNWPRYAVRTYCENVFKPDMVRREVVSDPVLT